jgi:predicted nuclease of predicted toxin-antitoxin system
MVLIADESVDYAIIQVLREIGYNVISIMEQSPGIDDKKVLAIANLHQGLLITEDKDFGELTYRLNKQHNGILLIRLSGLPRIERINLVSDLLKEHAEKLSGKFSVINEQGLRIKGKIL